MQTNAHSFVMCLYPNLTQSQAYCSYPAPFSHSKAQEGPAAEELDPGALLALERLHDAVPSAGQGRHARRESLQRDCPAQALGPRAPGSTAGCRALLLLLTQRSSPGRGSASRRENDCGTMGSTAGLGQLCHINCQQ